MTLHKVFLGLGANVGDKKANIKKAIELLKEKIANIAVASIYETKPWGYKEQDNFLNTAIKGNTRLSPSELFKFVKDIEKKLGRIKRFKWGPREIDIDVLFYNDKIYKDHNLEIPHSRLHERDFVLKPLMNLEPEFIHPIFKRTIKQLHSELPKELLSIIGVYEPS